MASYWIHWGSPCTFIVQISQETGLIVNMIVFTWKVVLSSPFSWEIELIKWILWLYSEGGLKRPFIDDIRKTAAHIHCSGFLGERAFSGYKTFTQKKMVLERMFVTDTRELWLCISIVQVSSDPAYKQYDSFTQKMILRGTFLVTVEKTQLCSFIFQVSWETEFICWLR